MKLTTKLTIALVVLLIACWSASAQETATNGNEKRVGLNEVAVAHDDDEVAALQGTLRTTALNGSPDSPVTNVSLIVKNTSGIPYAFVSGVVTFYDSAGIRCGEGIFKADALAVDESFETDSPGVRIRCEATTWRIVATHLLPRSPATPPPVRQP
ncbi:MAG TPA: hypothetical protein VFR51_07880 [Pyrinomonadaceae bacterium]|nr:hypothetical protein [Pyrinomonadaceae bacterium]